MTLRLVGQQEGEEEPHHGQDEREQRAPTEHLNERARYAGGLNDQLIDRARAAGAIRADLEATDLGLIFEQLAAIKTDDAERTGELRRRYLALILDAIRHPSDPLPGPPPRPGEFAGRWIPKSRS